jgi:hypothetical protein
MKSQGFVLVLCLCFVALMSCMLWSALTVSQLSHLIAATGSTQLQQRFYAEQRHQAQQQVSSDAPAERQLADCPAQYAVWLNAPTVCELVWLQTAASHEQPGQGSLLVRMQLTGGNQ